jgi:hypothetical protein
MIMGSRTSLLPTVQRSPACRWLGGGVCLGVFDPADHPALIGGTGAGVRAGVLDVVDVYAGEGVGVSGGRKELEVDGLGISMVHRVGPFCPVPTQIMT